MDSNRRDEASFPLSAVGGAPVDTSAKRTELEQAGVKYVLASFVDVHGIPKSKMVPIAHFDRMMNGSEL